jgi:hypothetical protein
MCFPFLKHIGTDISPDSICTCFILYPEYLEIYGNKVPCLSVLLKWPVVPVCHETAFIFADYALSVIQGKILVMGGKSVLQGHYF